MRSEFEARSNSSLYNQGTKDKQLIFEERATAINFHTLWNAFHAGKARDISDEPKQKNTPCIIVGSGPSLDDEIAHLKGWKGGIMCTTSHALTLMKHGIEPTHIIALDPFCTWEEIQGVDWSKTRTKLVCHPGTYPSLIENWPNEFLLFRENSGRNDSFYSGVQKRMYTWLEPTEHGIRFPIFHFMIKTEITLFACSPPMQMYVAQVLGYGNIFLCGVDFGFHSGKERFTSWEKKDGEWVEMKHPLEEGTATITGTNGVLTQDIHLYYKKNFMSAWRLSKQSVYTCDKGLISEAPYRDIEMVVRHQGKDSKHFPKQTEAFIADRLEPYLAAVGAYVVKTSGGLAFVEAPEPETDLPGYMASILNQYECTICHSQAQGNDGKDHTGEDCPACIQQKQIQDVPIGKLKHRVEVDIAENMKHIRKVVETANARYGLTLKVPMYPPIPKVLNTPVIATQEVKDTQKELEEKALGSVVSAMIAEPLQNT